MSLSPSLPDFTSRALAALQAGESVETPRATVTRLADRLYAHERPYLVRTLIGRETRHESAVLAVAFLRSL